MLRLLSGVNNVIWSFLDYIEDIAAGRLLRLPSNI